MKRHIGIILILLFGSLACTLSASPTSTAPSTVEFQEATPSPTGWITLSPGLTYREIEVEPNASQGFKMQVVRIDPTQNTFQVFYEPNNLLSSAEWQSFLQDARVIINASFFNELNQAIGLVASNGQIYGTSLLGFGGMFFVDVNGNIEVRSLVQSSYYGENLTHAVQGFPMLVEYGGVSASTGAGFDTPSRRTMLAQDFEGHILLFSTANGQLSLGEAQQWLLQSGLNINIAFNLDGGKSSMMILRPSAGETLHIPAFSKIPVVLAVYSQ